MSALGCLPTPNVHTCIAVKHNQLRKGQTLQCLCHTVPILSKQVVIEAPNLVDIHLEMNHSQEGISFLICLFELGLQPEEERTPPHWRPPERMAAGTALGNKKNITADIINK